MRLQHWQEKKGLSNSVLSQLLRVSRTTLYTWHRGVSVPTGANLARIMAVTDGEVTALDFAPERNLEVNHA